MKTLNPILRYSLLLFVLAVTTTSCKKDILNALSNEPKADDKGFKTYLIKAGNHYAEQNGYVPTSTSEMKFTVKFDNSAVYTTKSPDNAVDVNKLYGFSDNNTQHHEYSARFGWRYMNKKLTLHAYVYNNSIRKDVVLSEIKTNTEYACAIKVSGNQYLFTLNGKTTAVPRASTASIAEGYKLFPYFGGTEPAPHDIKIMIRDDN